MSNSKWRISDSHGLCIVNEAGIVADLTPRPDWADFPNSATLRAYAEEIVAAHNDGTPGQDKAEKLWARYHDMAVDPGIEFSGRWAYAHAMGTLARMFDINPATGKRYFDA